MCWYSATWGSPNDTIAFDLQDVSLSFSHLSADSFHRFGESSIATRARFYPYTLKSARRLEI